MSTFSLTYGIVLIVAAGRKLVAAGWGREWANNGTDENGNPVRGESPISPVLREVEVPFVNHEDCRKAWKGGEPFPKNASIHIYDFQVCAGESGKGVCFGDSGKIIDE